MQEAQHASKLSENYFWRQRAHSAFDIVYENLLKESQDRTGESVLPRQTKRLDNSSTSHEFESAKDYRQKYFEVLDNVTHELQRWFDQRDFCVG